MKTNYPTMLTIFIGVPFTIIGIIVFAIISNSNGQFDTIEGIVFSVMITVLIALGILDLVRWDNWKKQNH